jgi:hypothetical protein
MSLKKLPELLARIAEIFERSGAKHQAAGVRELKDVLAEEIANFGEDAIVVVMDRLELYSRPKKRVPGDRARASIEEYVARLESLAGEASLRELVGEFQGKSFKKTDLDKIAQRYAKGPSKYRNKAEAIQDIERRFLQRARAKNELEYLERKKVTPW